ncbi:MAG: hypothetical protein HRT66_05115, partial [Flavobacteriaceae bacterium]|nr:hypothetical protein [Flavobacteriaceae bacterium]
MKTILYTLIFISTLNLYSQVFFLGGVKKSVPEKKVLNTNGVWKVDSNGTHIGIWKIEDLEAIKDELSEKYVLMNDLDFDKDEDYRDNIIKGGFTSGEGWAPIYSFIGDFEGNNKTISNLFINRPDELFTGLFGVVNGSNIENIGILNCDITGGGSVGSIPGSVGGLVGYGPNLTIKNSYATGDITGDKHVGGLVGYSAENSTIETSYSKCTVTGNTYVGGLVGYMVKSTIENSYATGDVTGGENIGGLIGYYFGSSLVNNSLIKSSYATGTVTGDEYLGGLAGIGHNSVIDRSIAFNDRVNEVAVVSNHSNRVLGRGNMGYVYSSYANEDMIVGSSTRSSILANSYDGADMILSQMSDESFFTNQV